MFILKLYGKDVYSLWLLMIYALLQFMHQHQQHLVCQWSDTVVMWFCSVF